MPRDDNVARSLTEPCVGDQATLDALFSSVYNELRRLAAGYLRHERPDHTLQPTALVHEAYLRLVDQKNVDWQSRTQFFCLAAQAMRRILVNHARDRHAAKRGGQTPTVARRMSLDDAIGFFAERNEELVALDGAFDELSRLDPRQCRIVELKFFGGLTIEEIAEVTGVSPATVKREWRTAKAWLHQAVKSDK